MQKELIAQSKIPTKEEYFMTKYQLTDNQEKEAYQINWVRGMIDQNKYQTLLECQKIYYGRAIWNQFANVLRSEYSQQFWTYLQQWKNLIDYQRYLTMGKVQIPWGRSRSRSVNQYEITCFGQY